MVGVRQVRVRSYVQWRATAHVSNDEMKKVKEMELKKLHANTWMLLDYLTTWIPEYVRKDDEFVGGAVLI